MPAGPGRRRPSRSGNGDAHLRLAEGRRVIGAVAADAERAGRCSGNASTSRNFCSVKIPA